MNKNYNNLKIGDICYETNYYGNKRIVVIVDETIGGYQPILCTLDSLKEGKYSTYASSYDNLNEVIGHVDIANAIFNNINFNNK